MESREQFWGIQSWNISRPYPGICMKMSVFWMVHRVHIDRRFRGAYCLMEAVSSTETSVNIYQTTLVAVRTSDQTNQHFQSDERLIHLWFEAGIHRMPDLFGGEILTPSVSTSPPLPSDGAPLSAGPFRIYSHILRPLLCIGNCRYAFERRNWVKWWNTAVHLCCTGDEQWMRKASHVSSVNSFNVTKIEFFWVVTPCSHVGGYQRFGGINRFHLQSTVTLYMTTSITTCAYKNITGLAVHVNASTSPLYRDTGSSFTGAFVVMSTVCLTCFYLSELRSREESSRKVCAKRNTCGKWEAAYLGGGGGGVKKVYYKVPKLCPFVRLIRVEWKWRR
jgi:hypothetical protein